VLGCPVRSRSIRRAVARAQCQKDYRQDGHGKATKHAYISAVYTRVSLQLGQRSPPAPATSPSLAKRENLPKILYVIHMQ
jgi:hypothetical protein